MFESAFLRKGCQMPVAQPRAETVGYPAGKIKEKDVERWQRVIRLPSTRQ